MAFVKPSSLQVPHSQPVRGWRARHANFRTRAWSERTAIMWLWPVMLLSAVGLGISLLAVVLGFSARLNVGVLLLLSLLQLLAMIAIGRLIWQRGRF